MEPKQTKKYKMDYTKGWNAPLDWYEIKPVFVEVESE